MKSLHPSAAAGFTLIEAVVTIAILATLVFLTAPSVRDSMMNVRLTAQSNDLLTDLAMARSEAVKRDVQTAICVSTDAISCTAGAWELGWIIFVDENKDGQPDTDTPPLKRTPALEGRNTLTRTDNPVEGYSTNIVAYSPVGRAAGIGPGGAMFELRDSRGCGRNIMATLIGRASIAKVAC